MLYLFRRVCNSAHHHFQFSDVAVQGSHFPRGFESIEKVFNCKIAFEDLEKVMNSVKMYINN